jgi:putative membrane protein
LGDTWPAQERGKALSRILISWLINAIALGAAAYLAEGIRIVGEPAWLTVVLMALIFGLVNALIRPIIRLLTCPLIILTLGLFTLVINGLMLLLSAWLGSLFGVGFQVEGFWSALWGALIISVISWLLSILFLGDRNGRRRREERRRDRW